MALIAIHVEAILDCPKCEAGVPINGAVERLRCSQCQHVVELPPERWASIFGDLIGDAASYAVGRGSQATIISDHTYKVTYGRVPARCTACKAELAPQLLHGAAASGSLGCPSCGAAVAVREPPAWLADVHPLAKLLVGETLTAGAVEDDGERPTKIHCVSCGAGLEIDGSVRNVPCSYCKESTYIPDRIWHRIHPAATREPWLVCLDIGDGEGLLPEDVDDFRDLAPGPDGTMLIAYHHEDEETGEACRLAAVDRRGVVRWTRRDVDFGSEARFSAAAGGEVLVLVDKNGGYHGEGTAGFVFLDPRTGEARRRVDCVDTDGDWLRPSALRSPDVFDANGWSADVDGTFVVLQDGDRERSPTLVRFGADGTPLPLWTEDPDAVDDEPVERPGLLARLFGSKGRSSADGLVADVEPAAWGSLGDRLAVPPRRVVLAVGDDGLLYLVDEAGGHMAAYDRAGRLRYERTLDGIGAEEVHAVAAAADGTVYLLYEAHERWRGDRWSHVARARPDAAVEPWLGVLVPDSPSLIGEYDDRLWIADDGALLVGDELDSLRVIAPDGSTIWRSVATARNDRDAEEQLRRQRGA